MATYDPKEVQILVNGVPISGFADGSFLTINFTNPMWTKQVGADGAGVFSKSNDLQADIEFVLLPSSLSNDYLDGLFQADLASNAGLFNMVIKDNNGNSIYATEGARIAQQPGRDYQKEAQPVTWPIITTRLQPKTGGSTDEP